MSERKVLNVRIALLCTHTCIWSLPACLFRNTTLPIMIRRRFPAPNARRIGNSPFVSWRRATCGKCRSTLALDVFTLGHRCKTCGEYIYKGKKFNARKEDVMGEMFLGIQIYRFYIKCTKCLREITFKVRGEKVLSSRFSTLLSFPDGSSERRLPAGTWCHSKFRVHSAGGETGERGGGEARGRGVDQSDEGKTNTVDFEVSPVEV